MIRTVLTIAGSDPTGGAGIQADLKTMTALGVYGAAVITCITVQNSRGVFRVEPLHPVLVDEQIEAVFSDHLVSHVKIGMVGNAAISRTIARKLHHFEGEVIYDPVLVATTGQQLMEPEGLASLHSQLLPLTTVLTPNLPELEQLTGMAVDSPEKIGDAAKSLFRSGSRLRAVLVKGGHGDANAKVTDYLYSIEGGAVESKSFSHPFLRSANTHGTGCTLASAFAAYLAQDASYSAAFSHSVFFVQRLLRQSSLDRVVNNASGKGGLLHHLACAPQG